MVGPGREGDDTDMNYALAGMFAVVAVGMAAGPARADGRGTLVVPVVGEHGVAVYCTHNLSSSSAAPLDGGGYRVTGLASGSYAVRLVMPHERIDMIATVPAEGEVVVLPVVAHGTCMSVEVIARTAVDGDETPLWSVRYGRNYSAKPGLRQAALVKWAPRYRHAPGKKW